MKIFDAKVQAYSFLSHLVSTKLLDYSKKMRLKPKRILSLNISDAVLHSLRQLYKLAPIQNIQLEDLKKLRLSTLESCDLVIANLALVYDNLDLSQLFKEINNVLSEENHFIFATWDHSDKAFLVQPNELINQEILDERRVLAELDPLEVQKLVSFKEHLLQLNNSNETIECHIFVISKKDTPQPSMSPNAKQNGDVSVAAVIGFPLQLNPESLDDSLSITADELDLEKAAPEAHEERSSLTEYEYEDSQHSSHALELDVNFGNEIRPEPDEPRVNLDEMDTPYEVQPNYSDVDVVDVQADTEEDVKEEFPPLYSLQELNEDDISTTEVELEKLEIANTDALLEEVSSSIETDYEPEVDRPESLTEQRETTDEKDDFALNPGSEAQKYDEGLEAESSSRLGPDTDLVPAVPESTKDEKEDKEYDDLSPVVGLDSEVSAETIELETDKLASEATEPAQEANANDAGELDIEDSRSERQPETDGAEAVELDPAVREMESDDLDPEENEDFDATKDEIEIEIEKNVNSDDEFDSETEASETELETEKDEDSDGELDSETEASETEKDEDSDGDLDSEITDSEVEVETDEDEDSDGELDLETEASEAELETEKDEDTDGDLDSEITDSEDELETDEDEDSDSELDSESESSEAELETEKNEDSDDLDSETETSEAELETEEDEDSDGELDSETEVSKGSLEAEKNENSDDKYESEAQEASNDDILESSSEKKNVTQIINLRRSH